MENVWGKSGEFFSTVSRMAKEVSWKRCHEERSEEGKVKK